VDLISSYWASEAIAHIFGSFGFGGQEYVAISAEIRKARGQDYSTFKEFFEYAGQFLADASPAMFSAPYFAQLAAALRTGIHTGLVQISWPDKSVFARQG